ncbi:MAG: acetylpolyamine amidohydrolase [Halobacteriovorax sp.]|nr:acetylpolyamine amidohydrolase [Halobacteriovorax sp.]
MSAFKIRQVFDHSTPLNLMVIASVKKLLLSQFPYMKATYLEDLVERVTANKSSIYKHYLFVAEKKGVIIGAAIASHFIKENFMFLDYIASSKDAPSRGIGAALYSRVKDQSLINKSLGVFLEVETIERKYCASDEEQRQNVTRLKFYQRFGAAQLIKSDYERWRIDDSSLHLLFDNNKKVKLKSSVVKSIIRAILVSHTESKCPQSYIKKVLASLDHSYFEKLPPPKLSPQLLKAQKAKQTPLDQKISVTLNPLHKIHHIKEKGYVESPIRIDSILKEISKIDLFNFIDTKKFPDSHITEVHDPEYYQFLKEICKIAGKKTIYPDVFPVRNRAKLPKAIIDRAGYYCMDTFSPLNKNAFEASRVAVNCALTAASKLIAGDNISYALIRPPGHHAEKKYFGGFCYLNSTAIAANYLSKQGKVVILDVDYHHGNGQQNIFYKRSDVLTISIHGHPEHAYPHYTGFEEEKGFAKGLGYNINYPLEKTIDGATYIKTLRKAIEDIKKFDPVYCVIALGLDTAKGDPTGSWRLIAKDFEQNGFHIGSLKKPTLVVQEGGYKTQQLGINARHFFQGLTKGYYQA